MAPKETTVQELILDDLALISERLSHSLRSPLSVVQGLLGDLAAGYQLTTEDISDAQTSAARILEYLNLLRLFNLGTKPEIRLTTLELLLQSMARNLEHLRSPVRFLNTAPTQTKIYVDDSYFSQAVACLVTFVSQLRQRHNSPQKETVIEVQKVIDNNSVTAADQRQLITFRVGGPEAIEAGTVRSECALGELANSDQSFEALLLIFAEHAFNLHASPPVVSAKEGDSAATSVLRSRKPLAGNARVLMSDNGLPEFRIVISASE